MRLRSWRNSRTRLQSQEPPTQEQPASDLEVENETEQEQSTTSSCERSNMRSLESNQRKKEEDCQTTQRLVLPLLQVVLERGEKIEPEAPV